MMTNTEALDRPTRAVKKRRGASVSKQRVLTGDKILTLVNQPYALRASGCNLLMHGLWLLAFNGAPVRKKDLAEVFINHALQQDVPYFRRGNDANKKTSRKAAQEEACKQIQRMHKDGVLRVSAH